MADNKLIERSGERILTSTGILAAGAKVYVYDAGTTDLASIYTDADLTTASANPATCDSAGLCPYLYIGTGAYKLRVETSGGLLIDEEDDIPGATDTTGLTAEFASPQTPVVVKTVDYTTVVGDVGSLINANCTGANVEIELLTAADVANGRGFTIRHTGTANQVEIVTTSSESITGPATGVTTTAFALTAYGESVTLVSDGAGWHITSYTPPLIRNGGGPIVIADRISSAPGSPVAGARYIVTSSYSTFETGDIIEWTGQTGIWIEYSPPADCGWLAYVQDEDQLYQYQASAWVELAATQAQMETGTALNVFVTPARQKYSPLHPKAWGYITNTGVPALTAGANIASVSDSGTGAAGISFTTTMSSANYIAVGSFIGSPSGLKVSTLWANNVGTGGFTFTTVRATDITDTRVASADMSGGFIVMGDH